MSELLRPLALPFPLFLSCLPPPLAVRCPVVGPTPLAVAPRAAPSTAPAFLSLYIYILIRFWGVMASCGFVRSKRFCFRSGTSIFHPGS